jgi:acetyltransferase-like isoleucine patch superfamily enzyme
MEVSDTIRYFISIIRDSYARAEIRRLRKSLGACGKDVQIVYPFDIRGREFVYISENVFIGPRVLIGATKGAEIFIEDFVMLGPEVKLIGGDHRYDVPEMEIKNSGVGRLGQIRIKRGAWIGAGSIILRGISVGEGSILGAGSVLTKDLPSNEIWAGNPAKFVKRRY